VSDGLLELLRRGTIEVEGRFANSSNQTLLVVVAGAGEELRAVYKPEAGERPLWDFPRGLWRREIAAYVLDRHLGLGMVPETVERTEGPAGPGSLQRFVDEDLTSHYFTLREEPEHHGALRALAAFDVVANNSDRKSGHVLYAEERLYAIDHGLCFHEEDKLRTVIWDFAGEPLPEPMLEGLGRLLSEPPFELLELLSAEELARTLERALELLEAGVLPHPDEDRPYPPYPWPLV
jgi:uncharacterized repeat protein (TIGR03843 family)